MWQDRTDVCLLVPLWVRLHSGKGGDCAVPENAQVKKLMEPQGKKGEGGRGKKKKDRSEQKLQKGLRKAGNTTAIPVSEGRKENVLLGLGRELRVILCKPAELLD